MRLQRAVAHATISACALLGFCGKTQAGSLSILTATAGVDWGTARLSPDGQTVFGSFLSSPYQGGPLANGTYNYGLFSWNVNSGLTSLPTFPGAPTEYGAVRASSYNGSIVVGEGFDGVVSVPPGSRWGLAVGSLSWNSSGVAQVLPVGTFSNPVGVVSRATAISDDGSVIVGYSDPDNEEAIQETLGLGTPSAAHFDTPPDPGLNEFPGYTQAFRSSPTGTVVL